MRLSLPLVLALLPGCAWVTEADIDRRTPELDNDGDGVPAFEDCNDADATVSPVLPEVWYNGVDNNCDGKDDYDQDEDGFVGTGYDARPTEGVEGSGTLPGGDCDDVAPRVSPQQPDTWYDGVDQNCDGKDDFDQDGDGVVRDADLGRSTQYVDGSGALPAGDCDDTDGAYGPDREDAPYDGLDHDCDRLDDYDQDQDGWIRDEDAGKVTANVPGSGTLPVGDCDDTDAAIRPGGDDSWYDGVDSDCRADDDFDQDRDGVRAEGFEGGTDCDDTNPDAYPGALETLGDGVDADCVRGEDGVELDPAAGMTWASIRRIGLVASNSRVYLGVAARQIRTSALSLNNAVAFYHWLRADVSADSATFVPAFPGSSATGYELDDAAFQARTGTSDWFYVSFAAHDTARRQYFSGEYDVLATSGARTRSSSGTDSSTTVPISSVANAFDPSGVLHAVFCESSIGTTHWTRFASTGTTVSGLSSGDQDGYSTDACALAFVGSAPRVAFADTAGFEDWDLSWGTYDTSTATFQLTEIDSETLVRPVAIRSPAGFAAGSLLVVGADGVVYLQDGGTREVYRLGENAVQAEAVLAPDGVAFVAWVDADGSAWLSRDEADGNFVTSTLHTDSRAEQATVWADEDDVVVAVAGASDLGFISLAR
jgi:hypothetical protein